MIARSLLVILLGSLFIVAGCGGAQTGDSGSETAKSGQTATSSGAGTSRLDEGPRAADSPVDAALAAQGETLFAEKGCSACHAFGQKLSGPDLQGVASRRTAAWIESQILHPDEMTKTDPIARELLMKHALQMPNQGLTPDEAKAVVEFLKSKEPTAAAGE